MFPPVHQFKFRAGPYQPPAVTMGQVVHDEYLGYVKVEARTKAPIPWPASIYAKGRHAGPQPVLTGDLVRAVCEEDELTVAHYWGVTRHMVNEWKKAISQATDSAEVFVNLAVLRSDPAFRKKFGYQ